MARAEQKKENSLLFTFYFFFRSFSLILLYYYYAAFFYFQLFYLMFIFIQLHSCFRLFTTAEMMLLHCFISTTFRSKMFSIHRYTFQHINNYIRTGRSDLKHFDAVLRIQIRSDPGHFLSNLDVLRRIQLSVCYWLQRLYKVLNYEPEPKKLGSGSRTQVLKSRIRSGSATLF